MQTGLERPKAEHIVDKMLRQMFRFRQILQCFYSDLELSYQRIPALNEKIYLRQENSLYWRYRMENIKNYFYFFFGDASSDKKI